MLRCTLTCILCTRNFYLSFSETLEQQISDSVYKRYESIALYTSALRSVRHATFQRAAHYAKLTLNRLSDTVLAHKALVPRFYVLIASTVEFSLMKAIYVVLFLHYERRVPLSPLYSLQDSTVPIVYFTNALLNITSILCCFVSKTKRTKPL